MICDVILFVANATANVWLFHYERGLDLLALAKARLSRPRENLDDNYRSASCLIG